MDVPTTPASEELKRGEAAFIRIDQRQLRSILSNLSHELCRPLVSLRAGLDLLLAEVPSTLLLEQRDCVSTMVGLCDDLLRLTRSYLDYAGIIDGARPHCLGSYTIGALLGEVGLQFAPLAKARQVTWEEHADAPEVLVVTDASLCQQIFGNLVSNALKYTPTGGGVRITAKAESDSWSVTVCDSGPGIPDDALDAVFEPFFRLVTEEHSGREGSGLGLAICRELVSQLGGEIVLLSEPGRGTSVTVRFPLACPTAPARARCGSAPLSRIS